MQIFKDIYCSSVMTLRMKPVAKCDEMLCIISSNCTRSFVGRYSLQPIHIRMLHWTSLDLVRRLPDVKNGRERLPELQKPSPEKANSKLVAS
jgi:hypothetical protein